MEQVEKGMPQYLLSPNECMIDDIQLKTGDELPAIIWTIKLHVNIPCIICHSVNSLISLQSQPSLRITTNMQYADKNDRIVMSFDTMLDMKMDKMTYFFTL
jgi:hypothetical protein